MDYCSTISYDKLQIYIQDPPKYSIWIPDYQEKNLENKMKDFDGVFEKLVENSIFEIFSKIKRSIIQKNSNFSDLARIPSKKFHWEILKNHVF